MHFVCVKKSDRNTKIECTDSPASPPPPSSSCLLTHMINVRRCGPVFEPLPSFPSSSKTKHHRVKNQHNKTRRAGREDDGSISSGQGDNETSTNQIKAQDELIPLSRYRKASSSAEGGAGGGGGGGVGGGFLSRESSSDSRGRLLMRTHSYASGRLDSEMSDAALILLKEKMTSDDVSIGSCEAICGWMGGGKGEEEGLVFIFNDYVYFYL